MEKPYKKYDTNQALYDGLKAKEDAAYCRLLLQTKGMIVNLCKENDLQDMFEEIYAQSLMALMNNLENGTFEFKGHKPSTYFYRIALNIILSINRKPAKRPISIEDLENELWVQSEWNELSEEIEYCLSKLGEDCRKLILYLRVEGYVYKEILEKKLLPKLNSVEALANRYKICRAKFISIYKERNE
jgi:DNA-directed RNA polymerase specialized sigma24 family protein